MNDIIVVVFIISILLFIYFIPTFVAYRKLHDDFFDIFIYNIFYGYTIIGWIMVLIWARTRDDEL